MGLKLEPAALSTVALRPVVQRILEENSLCTVGTVNPDGTPHVSTAFYCVDGEWRLYFASDEQTQHSKNVEERASTAVAIFDSHQKWEDWKTGLQLFGRCAVARGGQAVKGEELYRKRFPAYAEWLATMERAGGLGRPATLYVFVPESVKLLDEAELGEETFVAMTLSRE